MLWVDLVVACVWKLRRVNVLERGVVEVHVNERPEYDPPLATALKVPSRSNWPRR